LNNDHVYVYRREVHVQMYIWLTRVHRGEVTLTKYIKSKLN